MKKLVIDVSEHNKRIDWKKVKASGVYGAMIRIGWAGYEGEIHKDVFFAENITGAYGAGLKVGLYVYAYNQSTKSAERTAEEIAAISEPYKYLISMPVAFDIEDTDTPVFTHKTKAENSEICKAFLNKIEQLGFKPMLYSYTSFIKCFIDMEMLKAYPLWIADYRDKTGEVCPYKGNFTMWQFIGKNGRTDGVAGPCDRNWLYEENPLTEPGEYDKLIAELEAVIAKYKRG